MGLTVAIASESPYDEAIYTQLASTILSNPITAWTGGYTFAGCKGVARLAPAFLNAAAAAGIRHAILAVDNDGGARRRPQHEAAHVPAAFDVHDDDSCRECWLGQAALPAWVASGAKLCLAVPVQTIETWLLGIRGHAFTSPTPEQTYYRPGLKKTFWGKSALPIAAQKQLAMAELQKPNAMATLALRPSFVRFAAQFTAWP